MSVEQTLTVALDERSYPIYIGTALLEDPALLARHIGGSQVAVITNEVLAGIALPQLLETLAGCNAQGKRVHAGRW